MYKSRSGYSDDDIFRLVKDDAFVNQLSFTEKTDLMYDYCDALENFYISNNSYSAEKRDEIHQIRVGVAYNLLSHHQELKNKISQNNTELAKLSKKFSLGIIGSLFTAFVWFIIFVLLFAVLLWFCSLIFNAL